ncbi:MAG: GGDEF domain-containing protein, partial [Lachnospiraceae bacterium]|nr:GGDEF domain-containing protein [Lachnospiraceae bacterium]
MADVIGNGEERIQQLEQQLEMEKQKYRIISGMVKCGLWEYTVSTGVLVQCRLGEGMGEKDRLLIRNFRESLLSAGLVYEADLPVFDALCNSLQNGDEAFSYDIRSYVDDKKTMWLRYEGYTVFNSKGEPAKVMGRTLNVDQEKKDEQVTMKDADKDNVTGLFTQNVIREKVEDWVKNSKDTDRFAFFVLSVDDFSSITDEYGHAYGEYILEKLAGALGSVFLDSDCLAHTTDDEFIMLKNEIRTPAEVYAIARAVGKAAERIELKRGGGVTVNIGVAIFPNDGRDYTSLHKKASVALEAAQRNVNNNCTIYDESLELHHAYRPAHETAKPEPEKTEAKKIVEHEQQTQYGPVERNIVNRIFDFLAGGGTDAELQEIFGEIGKYYGYQRIYAVVMDPQKQQLWIRYNWESSENPHTAAFEEVLRSARKELKNRFTNDPAFICTNSAQLGLKIPDEIKEQYPDASVFQYAIIDSADTFAYLTFVKEVDADWKKEEQDILSHLSRLLGIYVERSRTKEMLSEEVRYARAIIENQQITNYAIRPDTFELVYVGDYTGR